MQDKKKNSKKAGKPIASIPERGKIAWLDCLAFGGEGRQEYQTANGAPSLREAIEIGQNGTLSKFLLAIVFLPLLGGHTAAVLASGLGENRLDASELGAVSYPANFTARSPMLLSETYSKGEDTENCIWVGDCE